MFRFVGGMLSIKLRISTDHVQYLREIFPITLRISTDHVQCLRGMLSIALRLSTDHVQLSERDVVNITEIIYG